MQKTFVKVIAYFLATAMFMMAMPGQALSVYGQTDYEEEVLLNATDSQEEEVIATTDCEDQEDIAAESVEQEDESVIPEEELRLESAGGSKWIIQIKIYGDSRPDYNNDAYDLDIDPARENPLLAAIENAKTRYSGIWDALDGKLEITFKEYASNTILLPDFADADIDYLDKIGRIILLCDNNDNNVRTIREYNSMGFTSDIHDDLKLNYDLITECTLSGAESEYEDGRLSFDLNNHTLTLMGSAKAGNITGTEDADDTLKVYTDEPTQLGKITYTDVYIGQESEKMVNDKEDFSKVVSINGYKGTENNEFYLNRPMVIFPDDNSYDFSTIRTTEEEGKYRNNALLAYDCDLSLKKTTPNVKIKDIDGFITVGLWDSEAKSIKEGVFPKDYPIMQYEGSFALTENHEEGYTSIVFGDRGPAYRIKYADDSGASDIRLYRDANKIVRSYMGPTVSIHTGDDYDEEGNPYYWNTFDVNADGLLETENIVFIHSSSTNEEDREIKIAVEGNAGVPSFKSDNSSVATVTVDSSNKNKAIIKVAKNRRDQAAVTITVDKKVYTLRLIIDYEEELKGIERVSDSEITVYAVYEDGKWVPEDGGTKDNGYQVFVEASRINGMEPVMKLYEITDVVFPEDATGYYGKGGLGTFIMGPGDEGSPYYDTGRSYGQLKIVFDGDKLGDTTIKLGYDANYTDESHPITINCWDENGDIVPVELPYNGELAAHLETSIEVHVIGRFSDEEQENMLNSLYPDGVPIYDENGDVVGHEKNAAAYVLSETGVALSDIPLPNNGKIVDDKGTESTEDDDLIGTFVWTRPNDIVTADANRPLQNQMVTFIPANANMASFDASVNVAVSKLSQITVVGDSVLCTSGYRAQVEDEFDTYDTAFAFLNYSLTGYGDLRDINLQNLLKSKVTYTWTDETKKGYFVLKDGTVNELEVLSSEDYPSWMKLDPNFKTFSVVQLNLSDGVKNGTVRVADGAVNNLKVVAHCGSKDITAKHAITLLQKYVREIEIDVEHVSNTFSEWSGHDERAASIVPGDEWNQHRLVIDYTDVSANVNASNKYADPTYSFKANVKGSENTKIVWTSSDPGIVKVKSDAAGDNVTLTFSKKSGGSATITGTAKDKAATTVEILVEVLDYSPVATDTQMTINPYQYVVKESGSPVEEKEINPDNRVYIPVIGRNGAEVTDVDFAAGDPDAAIYDIVAEEVIPEGGSDPVPTGNFYLVVKHGTNIDSIPKKKEKNKEFIVTTTRHDDCGTPDDPGDDTDIETKYVVKYLFNVDTTKPTAKAVSLVQTAKPNIFYNTVGALWTFSSKKFPIEDVAVYDANKLKAATTVEEREAAYLKCYNGPEGGDIDWSQCDYLVFRDGDNVCVEFWNQKTADLYKASLGYTISFEDYNDRASLSTDLAKPVKFATVKKAPVYKIAQIDAITGHNSENTYLTDSKGIYTLLDSAFTVTVPANLAGKVSVVSNSVEMTEQGGAFTTDLCISNLTGKALNYQLEIKGENWAEPVKVAGKYNYLAQRALSSDNSKVTLNTATNVSKTNDVEIPVYIKNSLTRIDTIYFSTDVKTADKLDKLRIRYDDNRGIVLVGIKDGLTDGEKASLTGRMNLYLTGASEDFSVPGGMVKTKPLTVAVTFVDKAMTANISFKTSLNTLDRENPIKPIVKLTNTNTGAEVDHIDLMDNGTGYSKYFWIQYNEDGMQGICARWDAPLSTKQSYTMGAKLYLTDGSVIMLDGVTKNQIVTIKPVQKLPKVTLERTVINMFKGVENEVKYIGITPAYGKVNYLDRKANDKYLDAFWVYMDWGRMDNVMILEKSDSSSRNLKAGKYAINITYTMDGWATNIAPATAKLTVNLVNGTPIEAKE